MNKNKVLINVFSNWTNLILTIAIAFIVSPILVNKLGNEAYGVWVLVISITGYFTILDFGVNTAIVRYISKYLAQKNYHKANQVYNCAFAFFTMIALLAGVTFAILGYFYADVFTVQAFNKTYLYSVFLIIVLDFALNLTFGVFQGALRATHNFLHLNGIAIVINITKNIVIVVYLLQGHSLLTIATIQISASIVRFVLQFILIKSKADFLHFSATDINFPILKKIINYSIYSFMISIAMKLLFYTDSIVIGAYINVSQVTYYAIAQMIVEHLEKILWAVIAVLIPIISSLQATGKNTKNKDLYIHGTRYSLLFCAPIILSLFAIGDDFIALWMGTDYREISSNVLMLLLCGYIFSLAQLIAHGILKGISRHKSLAYLLIIEAISNVLLSIYLAPRYGLYGVALGTAIPLLISNFIILPYFTCRELKLNYGYYFRHGLIHPLLILIGPTFIIYSLNINVESYWQIALFCGGVSVCYLLYTLAFILNSEHKRWIFSKLSNACKLTKSA